MAFASLSYAQYKTRFTSSKLAYLVTATGFAISVTVWSLSFNVPINNKLAALQGKLERRAEDVQLTDELVSLHHEWRSMNAGRNSH